MKAIIGGHYQIVKELASGGFGQTYIAKDIHLPDKPLRVVKLLKPLTISGSEIVPLAKDHPTFSLARRLFDKEAQVLYKLGVNDQIPQLFGHFEEEEDFFLVQQLIEGKDLSEEILDKQLSQTEVIDLLIDILTPLAFVHQHKVIHRDLKPDNLIRRKSDRKIVLIDFGAVKEVISQTTITDRQARTIAIGTPGYMPTEQGNGKPTLSSDIYAVGMIGIQSLTGLYPTLIPNDPMTGEIQWQDSIEVDPKLAEILNKMIAEDFRQRYKSAQEALEAVSSLQDKSDARSVSSKPVETFVIDDNTTEKNSDRTKSKINNKLMLSIVALFLALVTGYVILTRTLDTTNTNNSPSSPEKSKDADPAF
ncbi:serine/threonine protein kinase [Waterburya agarophytonicola K14]|uniref:non-specific serine/threonine protein kinase n=1 Tax=Waterburya agarophytonicola KI4 TaxID=2874699 RepID=A0A964FGJ2_9CYAN|nr:serine/threonine-protein kinase [Waterburya agarophytonicola]MCC0178091.1 serine/threonine protein kinase [Waterburya agarophytonicola KI4]